jgi:predicted DNA-binding protein
MKSKAVSVRLPEKLAVGLAAIARAEGVPISETVRAAIEEHLATRSTDPIFQEHLRKRLEEDAEILKRFSD